MLTSNASHTPAKKVEREFNKIIRVKTKQLILYSFIFFSLNSVFAQVDTFLLAKNAKLWFIPELHYGLLTKQEIKAFYDKPLEIKFLKSKGFKNLVFFKVDDQMLVEIMIKNGDIKSLPIPLSGGGFTMAYSLSGNNLFRVSGFKNNDFNFLIKNISFYSSSRIRRRRKILHKYLWIEDVNMKQLIRNLPR